MKQPTNEEVHVWRGATRPARRDDFALLAPDERARYERIRDAGERARFCSARVGLRRIVGAYLGVPPSTVTFGRAACPGCGDMRHGPPLVTWPKTNLMFSVSHSGYRWLVAVCDGGPIGADVECNPERDLTVAIRDVLTAAELGACDALASELDRRRFLLRAWTRKEAVCKALGVGLVANVHLLDVEPARPSPMTAAFGIDGRAPTVWTIVDIPGESEEFAALARPLDRGLRLCLHDELEILP